MRENVDAGAWRRGQRIVEKSDANTRIGAREMSENNQSSCASATSWKSWPPPQPASAALLMVTGAHVSFTLRIGIAAGEPVLSLPWPQQAAAPS
jgi:hypothetical protein